MEDYQWKAIKGKRVATAENILNSRMEIIGLVLGLEDGTEVELTIEQHGDYENATLETKVRSEREWQFK